jgi:DNA-binding MarR family transcriptional regulator
MHLNESFLTPHACMAAHLKRASRRADQIYEEQLRAVGLKGTQFTLLRALSETGAIGIQAFAEVLRMDRTTLTRNLNPLLQAGYLKVTPDAQDKRSKKVQITPAGLFILQEALPLWQKAQQQVLDYMGSDSATLLSLLKKVSQMA